MAAKKVGTLIKEARTAAGLTQEQLAKKVTGASASDISKAERGLKDLTQAQLKQVAKATGVTQTSLLNAPKNTTSSSSSAKKPSSSKTSTSKTTSMKLTATEKKLVEQYRKADSDAKKTALKVLKGEKDDLGDILKDLLADFTKKSLTRAMPVEQTDEEIFLEVFGEESEDREDGASDEE